MTRTVADVLSPRSRLAAAAAVLAVALAGCTQTVAGRPRAAPAGRGPAVRSPSASLPPVGGDAAAFASCAGLRRHGAVSLPSHREGVLEFGCARIKVPLDYEHPAAGTISLQLLRVHDTETSDPRTLIVNPGGPGGSAVSFLASSLAGFPAAVYHHFDLLAFDPRGTGLSHPLRCVSDAERDRFISASPDVTTPAGFAAAKALTAGFVRGCARAEGAALRNFDTVATARDMDRVRAALGLRTVDYLGFSYGTTLGSVYAHLFPRRIGAAVLDGAVNPLTSGIQQSADQIQGFERAFDQFSAWCKEQKSCALLGDARTGAEQILAAAARSPLATRTHRTLTPMLATTGIIEALYSEALWPTLSQALADARGGSGRGLLALADRYYQRRDDGSYASNLLDAFTVISCNDSPPGPSDAALHAAVRSWVHRFPLFGKWSAPELFLCQSWPAVRTVPPRPAAATRETVLVLGNLHDPATPYRGARDLAKVMGNAEVLTWDGQGHTSYLRGSSCIDRYVDDYLISAHLPPDATVCRT